VIDTLNTITGSSIIEFLSSFVTGETVNYGKWSNAEYDKLVEQVVATRGPLEGGPNWHRKAQGVSSTRCLRQFRGASYDGVAPGPDDAAACQKGGVIHRFHELGKH